LDFGSGHFGSVNWEWGNMDGSWKSWLSCSSSDGNGLTSINDGWTSGISDGTSGISDGTSGISNSGSCGIGHGWSSNDRSGKDGWSSGNDLRWADWEVSSGNSESVDGVSDVVGVLDESVGINERVLSSNISESVLALSLGGWTTGISVAVLTKLILAVELAGGGALHDGGVRQGGNHSRGGNSQNASENDNGLHFMRLELKSWKSD
jgi:hypothetical protein